MEAESPFPEANQGLICSKPWSLNPSQTLINVFAVLPHCEVTSPDRASDRGSPPPPQTLFTFPAHRLAASCDLLTFYAPHMCAGETWSI